MGDLDQRCHARYGFLVSCLENGLRWRGKSSQKKTETAVCQGREAQWVLTWEHFRRFDKIHLQWLHCVDQILCKTLVGSAVVDDEEIVVEWLWHQPVWYKRRNILPWNNWYYQTIKEEKTFAHIKEIQHGSSTTNKQLIERDDSRRRHRLENRTYQIGGKILSREICKSIFDSLGAILY